MPSRHLLGRVWSDDSRDAENMKRLEVNRRLKPERSPPLSSRSQAKPVVRRTGQIFGVRSNEIYLFSQPRPIRTAHTAEGWTPETIIERVLPAFRDGLFPSLNPTKCSTGTRSESFK